MSTIRRKIRESCKAFVERLSMENREFYESDRGKGALKDLQQKFPHTWLYVAELIQNAVDEKATFIQLEKVNDNTLIFQHNGKAFDYDKDVIGLCTKGVSAKGAGTVGFMGVGFKAVFRSYETVRISSGNWKFYLKVDVKIGKEYGDQQPNWLGAVLPIWDDSIYDPSEGMTCRFELTNRVVKDHSIESDLEAVFKEDKALLPLLARQNVQILDWNGIKWVLSVDKTVPFQDSSGNRFHIGALSDASDDIFSWIIFSQEYTPSPDAICKFLEHRQLSASTPEEQEKIYSDASRIRRVEAFFQIDKDLFPMLPDTGEAYALLPTRVKLPIGINIHADWLLTQSRQEFMDADLKDNPWHKEIIENIPKITRHYFEWILSDDGPSSGTWESAYKILPFIDKSAIESYGWFLGNGILNSEPNELEYCKLLCEELRDIEFIARHIPEDKIDFILPNKARILPENMAKHCGENLELLPWILFGENLASRDLIGKKAIDTLTCIGLLKELGPNELADFWEQGVVKSWYEYFDEDTRDHRLERLLHGLSEMDEVDDWENAPLKCLPSEKGEFIDRPSATRYPGDWSIIEGNLDFVSILKPFLEDQGNVISWNFDRTVTSRQQHMRTKAKDYIETINQADLEEVVSFWWHSLEEYDDFDIDLISKFTAYICEKQPQRNNLIKKVICSNDQAKILCDLNEALLAEPYASKYRKIIFPEYPTISNCYFNTNDSLKWRTFFESCNPSTNGRFTPKTVHIKMDTYEFDNKYPNSPKSLRSSRINPIPWSLDENIRVDHYYFHFIDFKFDESINEKLQNGMIDRYFGEWLNEDIDHLRVYIHKYLLYIPYGCGGIREDKQNEVSDWIHKLSSSKWIYSKTSNTGPYKPEDVLSTYDPVRPEAPVADLSHDLIQLLESAGIRFGTQVLKAGPIQKLQVQGEYLSPIELLDVIEEIIQEIDDEGIERLKVMLESKSLIPVPIGVNLLDGSKRVSFSRIVEKYGAGSRSNLKWVVEVSELITDPSIKNIFSKLDNIYKFPRKTTANQAIDFLEWVWDRKPDAESVRRFLPLAYAYINEEMENNGAVKTRWINALSKAAVYTLGRRWVQLKGSDTIYFDDLQITEYKIIRKENIVTPSHLGSVEHPDQQKEAAHLLGLRLVSHDYRMISEKGESLLTDHSWSDNFIEIQKSVVEFLKISEDFDDSDEEIDTNEDSDKKQNLGLECVSMLSQKIVRLSDNQVLYTKPVNAIQKDDTALVCGEPTDFSSELCILLISYYNANRKKNISILASEMTLLLTWIEHPDFAAKLDKFKNKFGIETSRQKSEPATETNNDSTDIKPEAEKTQSHSSVSPKIEEDHHSEPNNQFPSETKKGKTSVKNSDSNDANTLSEERAERKETKPTNSSVGNQAKSGGSEDKPPSEPGQGKSPISSGHNKATKKSNRLISYVTGETTASDNDYEIEDDESPETIAIGKVAELCVIDFEKDRGWEPININDEIKNHKGYDIESTDPHGRLIYIEVKGINGPWTNIGVGLTAAQFRYASKYQDDYYLYVVDNVLRPEHSNVYRIKNPSQQITKFQFDHGWKNVAIFETESTEQTVTNAQDFVGQRVTIDSMGCKEGYIRKVTEQGKLIHLLIILDDGKEISKLYNPIDVKII